MIKTPKEFCVFKRKAAWFFQAACNGFKKVDAPTHIDLRFKVKFFFNTYCDFAFMMMRLCEFLTLKLPFCQSLINF